MNLLAARLLVFEFRLVLLSDWLPTNAKKPILFCLRWSRESELVPLTSHSEPLAQTSPVYLYSRFFLRLDDFSQNSFLFGHLQVVASRIYIWEVSFPFGNGSTIIYKIKIDTGFHINQIYCSIRHTPNKMSVKPDS